MPRRLTAHRATNRRSTLPGAGAAVLVLAALSVACDDAAGPGDGSPSSFEVYVYVEVDDTAGMGPSDEPVAATVTVSGNDDLLLVDSTGADGHVRFGVIPSGAYTVSHVATAQPEGTRLKGSAVQTVVAPFDGTEVETRFIYEYTASAAPR